MTSSWPVSWTPVNLRESEVPPLAPSPLKGRLCPYFHGGNFFQGCNLEKTMCGWDHPNSLRGDETQIRPSYKLLRFRGECGDLHLQAPGQATHVCPLAYGIWSENGANFRFYWGELRVCKPTGKAFNYDFHLSDRHKGTSVFCFFFHLFW